MAGRNGEIKIGIVGDAAKAQKALQDTAKATQGLEKQVGQTRTQLAGFAQAMAGAFGAQKIVAFAKGSIKAFGDLGESVNKSQELFGGASKSVEEFASKAAKDLGQSRTAALEAATTFAVFGKSAGKTGEDLAEFSTTMVTLASDLASFHNTRPEEAVYALGAALRGEYEPARRFGYQLDAITIGARAVEMGLTDNAKVVDQHSKTLAVQSLLMSEAGDAVGDFARTSDSATNAQRILAAQMEEVKIGLGSALMPAFEAVLGVVMPLIDAFNNMDPALKNTISVFVVLAAGAATMIITLSGLKTALEGIGLAAAASNPWLIGLMATLGAVAVVYGTWTAAQTKAKEMSDALAAAIRQTTEQLAAEAGLLEELQAQLGGVDSATATMWETFKNDGKMATDALSTAMEDLNLSWERLYPVVSKGTDGVREFILANRDLQRADEETRQGVADAILKYDKLEDILTATSGSVNQWVNANKETVRSLEEVNDAQENYQTIVEGGFETEWKKMELADEVNRKLWEEAEAIQNMGRSSEDAATFTEVLSYYQQRQAQTAEMAARHEEALAAAQEEATETAWTEASVMEELSASIAASQASYDATVKAAEQWAEGIHSSMASGSQSFFGFAADADTSAADMINALKLENLSHQQWEQNLRTVFENANGMTDEKKAEFIAYLSEMGLAGAPMVADLAANTDLIGPLYDEWVTMTEGTGDNMIGGLDPVAEGMREKMKAADAVLKWELALAASLAEFRSKKIGTGIIDGAEAGINEGAPRLSAAIQGAVNDALADTLADQEIKSPSALWAREVGVPVAEGIAEGIVEAGDSIYKALVSAIETATEEATKAAQELVDTIGGKIDELWESISGRKSLEKLVDAVAEAEEKLAAAKDREDAAPFAASEAKDARDRAVKAAADALRKYGAESQEYADAQRDAESATREYENATKEVTDATKAREDAEKRLEDTSLKLLQATTDNITAGVEQRLEWIELAKQAGLTKKEIDGLVASVIALAAAQGNAGIATAGIDASSARAQLVNADFAYAVKQGWVDAKTLELIKALSPAEQIDTMAAKLNDLQRYFGFEVKAYARGTNFHTGGRAIVGEYGPEMLELPVGSRVSPTGTGGASADEIRAAVTAGMIDGWRRVRQMERAR